MVLGSLNEIVKLKKLDREMYGTEKQKHSRVFCFEAADFSSLIRCQIYKRKQNCIP